MTQHPNGQHPNGYYRDMVRRHEAQRQPLPPYAESGRNLAAPRPSSPQSDASSPRRRHGSLPRTVSVLDLPIPEHIQALMDRFRDGPRSGPWDEDEDNILLYFVDGDRNKNWVRIASRMKFRTAKQCRERYFQSLRTDIIHTSCTPDEARTIVDLVNTIGTRWADISRHLGNRSDNWVKNWYNGQKHERNKASRLAAHSHRLSSPSRSRAGPAYRARAATRARDAAGTATMSAVPHAAQQQQQQQLPRPTAMYSPTNQQFFPAPPMHQWRWSPSNGEANANEAASSHFGAQPARVPVEYRPDPLRSPYQHHSLQPPAAYGYDRRPSTAAPSSEASPRPSRLSDTGSPTSQHYWSSASSASSVAGSQSTMASSVACSSQHSSPALPVPAGYALPLPLPLPLPQPSGMAGPASADFSSRLREKKAAPEEKRSAMSLNSILN